jgi:hypothetical protein
MKRVLGITAVALVFALSLAGCGSSNNTTNASAQNTTISTGDGTLDSLVKCEVNFSALTLTGSGGTATTGNLLSKSTEVEFVHQAGTFEPLAVLNIPPGTYSGATFTATGAEVVVMNTAVPPAPVQIPASLSASTVSVTFPSPITISNTTSSQINFDMDLAGSVTLNGAPPTSATIAPKFNVTTSTVANSDSGDGEVDDVHGSVTAINAPNFTIQTKQATITFATDNTTQFKDGITGLSGLKVGDIVEVDGTSKPDGSKLATKVELEEGSSGEEAEGMITAVTGAPATQVTIAHQVDSSNSAAPPVTVNASIGASTQFIVRADKLNLSSTPAFDASNIGKGQRVEVDSSSTASPLAADKIKLREQALIGTVSAPSASGFTLTLNSGSAFATLSGTTTVSVSIVSGTNLKVTPAAAATVRVRGLVFFNGTTYSMVAARVDNNN